MAKILLAALAVVVVVVIGTIVALALWDVPAPVQHVEHVIPDAKLGK